MKITLLGSASALATAERDHTFMVVEVQGDLLLIDCGGSPTKKLLQVGLDYTTIDHILVTHWHQDHTYGLVSLLHEMLLVGRKRELEIFLPHSSLRVVKRFLEAYFCEEEDVYEIEYHPLEMAENALVLRQPNYKVCSTPVVHRDGTLAYKIVEEKRSASGPEEVTFVYSSDTKPCESLIRFARGADLLIHECTYLDGEEAAVGSNHTTARQAGRIAAEANVNKLVLVHLGIEAIKNPREAFAQATEEYSGQVVIGQDFLALEV
jgi:ribonuclease Z